MTLDFETLVPKIDAFLARGLSQGLGQRDGQMCVEAAICAALDLPHGDDPGCVDEAVRRFKIRLNDSAWSSPQARAEGMRDLAIAQLGTKGTIDRQRFVTDLVIGTVREILSELPRVSEDVRNQCRAVTTLEDARTAAKAVRAAAAAAAAADAAAAAAAAADAATATAGGWQATYDAVYPVVRAKLDELYGRRWPAAREQANAEFLKLLDRMVALGEDDRQVQIAA